MQFINTDDSPQPTPRLLSLKQFEDHLKKFGATQSRMDRVACYGWLGRALGPFLLQKYFTAYSRHNLAIGILREAFDRKRVRRLNDR